VNRWRNDNPYFKAEFNKERSLIWGGNQERLRSLATKAIDTLEAAMDDGDSRAAVEVIKAVSLYGHVEPPTGPTDPELVRWQEAKEWAAAEIAKRGPSSDPYSDIMTRDIEMTRLARERMEELRQQESDA
jgi:hypothetical protein